MVKTYNCKTYSGQTKLDLTVNANGFNAAHTLATKMAPTGSWCYLVTDTATGKNKRYN